LADPPTHFSVRRWYAQQRTETEGCRVDLLEGDGCRRQLDAALTTLDARSRTLAASLARHDGLVRRT
jgi:hypothetical protein